MNILYAHTQIGYLLIRALSAGIVVVLLLSALLGFNIVALVVLFILIYALVMMPTLSVTVSNVEVLARFGLGVVRKSIPLREIESCGVVKIPWYAGWGVRWIPRGWVFRVSGLQTVEIRRRGKKSFFIGSDEPEKLVMAINAAIGGLR